MTVSSKNIVDYIEYLKSIGFTVSLHGRIIGDSAFLNCNYHQNPYCHYVKAVFGKWDNCIVFQEKVVNKAKDGSFFGCCYAGVGEFVYPVKVNDEIVCFISVSGYKSDISDAKSRHFTIKYSLPTDEISLLAEKYLKTEIPKKEFVDTLILPLTFMLESYFSKPRDVGGNEVILYHKILRFVTENCHQKITMKQLSEKFNYSISTLSHLFLKNSGKSLPEYIDDLRLNEAKWYLANSTTPITEIAMFLGYSSSNYFSSVFKAKFGVTPREFRKSSQDFK